jgi:hypothetical protein
MTRDEELEAMELDELKDLFVKGLRKIANEGAARGLTEQESLAEYPSIVAAMAEIERISECPIEEL